MPTVHKPAQASQTQVYRYTRLKTATPLLFIPKISIILSIFSWSRNSERRKAKNGVTREALKCIWPVADETSVIVARFKGVTKVS